MQLHPFDTGFDPEDPYTIADALGMDAELASQLAWAHNVLLHQADVSHEEQFGHFSDFVVRTLCGMVKDNADRAEAMLEARAAAARKAEPADDRERRRVAAPAVSMDRAA